jgi:hypothetical protein
VVPPTRDATLKGRAAENFRSGRVSTAEPDTDKDADSAADTGSDTGSVTVSVSVTDSDSDSDSGTLVVWPCMWRFVAR